MGSYGLKIIQSGNVVEVYDYKEMVYEGYQDTKKKSKGRQAVATKDDKEINRDKVLKRARKTVRGIINSNVRKYSKFLTLTFADNVQDLPSANYEFKKFIQRWSYELGYKVQYTAVVEFQDRGAIHFHVMVYNVNDKIDVNQLSKIWGQGFIKINAIKGVDNVGAYICKYMTKCEDEKKLRGKKMYFNSRGLNKPIEIKDPVLAKAFAEGLEKTGVPKYANVFRNEFNTVIYKQYVLD